MTAFSEVAHGRAPSKTLLVPTSAFADSWDGKPNDSVCVGLRLVAAGDAFTARAEASKAAWKDHPLAEDVDGRTEAYNDTLMRWIVARGTCDPNNVKEPAEIWGGTPEDTVFEALTPDGVRFIFDTLERFFVETSPTQPELDVDSIADLPALFDEVGNALDDGERRRVLRFLGFAAEPLIAAKQANEAVNG